MKNVENDIEKLYEGIKEKLNENSVLYIYTPNGFVEHKTHHNKDKLSIKIKIKKYKKSNILQTLEKLKLNYKITNDNKYYADIEIKIEII